MDAIVRRRRAEGALASVARPPDARAPAENARRASRISRLESCSDGRARTARVARRRSRRCAGTRRGRGRSGSEDAHRADAGARWTAARCRAHVSAHSGTINQRDDRCCLSQTSQRALQVAMSEADGALISHLDDLQARLSRVAGSPRPWTSPSAPCVPLPRGRSKNARRIRRGRRPSSAPSPRPRWKAARRITRPAMSSRGGRSDDTKSPPDTSRGARTRREDPRRSTRRIITRRVSDV